MKKYEFEVTSVFFLEYHPCGVVEANKDKVLVSAKDFCEGMYKAVDKVKQEYALKSENYDNCIKTGWAYFNVGVTI